MHALLKPTANPVLARRPSRGVLLGVAVAVTLSLTMTGCGSGDGPSTNSLRQLFGIPTDSSSSGSTTTTTTCTSNCAPGIWRGTRSDTGAVVQALVMSDNTYYLFYNAPSTGVLQGAIYGGLGYSASNVVTANSSKDFNTTVVNPSLLNYSGNYVARTSWNGTFTYPAGSSFNISTSYDSTSTTAANLANIVGSYAASNTKAVYYNQTETLALTLLSNGTFTGTSELGCALSGTMLARTDVNAYDVSILFGAAPCKNANSSYTGKALYNSSTRQLSGVVTDVVKSDSFLFVGTRS